jgi:exodeoxyribonuclease V alpha subunit
MIQAVANPATKTRLTGKIGRITFQAADTGYCVFRFDLAEEFRTICAVGVMPDISEGAEVELTGEWKTHPRFGDQFAFAGYLFPEPEGKDGTIAFLETLKGCGPSLAQKIWDKFGDFTIPVMDDTPEQLLQVPGIGPKKHSSLMQSYANSRELRRLIAFLHTIGVTATYANRIYKKYGGAAIVRIKEDPYILAEQVRGFGFAKADDVARSMGIAEGSEVRIKAAILYTLKEAANRDGHCYLYEGPLQTACAELLTLPGYRPQGSDISSIVFSMDKITVDRDRIYLSEVKTQEERLAKSIKRLAGKVPCNILIDEFISEFEADNFPLGTDQSNALRLISGHGLSILTGGPGTGKSSVSKAVLELWHQQRKRVVAAAPTGKAALRLYQATGIKAKTIHQLLGFNGFGFARDQNNPLDGDAFLIDESSMNNLKLFDALIAAIPINAVVCLVGDVDQLPAIGAGNVLSDLIDCGQIPVARLKEIFRQGPNSKIVTHCQSILSGRVPDFEILAKDLTTAPITDCLFLPCDREKIPVAIEWLLNKRLPAMGIERNDIQVLSPMHKTDTGNNALNEMTQNAWNPKQVGGSTVGGLREGDRIIQTRNDYQKNVCNGDIATIEKIDPIEKEIICRFDDIDNPDGRLVIHGYIDIDDIDLAYSISIHKSQGSEFPVVVMPASMSHYLMLQRNLLFTGMSRGKKLVILVGEDRAIAQAVRSIGAAKRNTGLMELLAA